MINVSTLIIILIYKYNIWIYHSLNIIHVFLQKFFLEQLCTLKRPTNVKSFVSAVDRLSADKRADRGLVIGM